VRLFGAASIGGTSGKARYSLVVYRARCRDRHPSSRRPDNLQGHATLDELTRLSTSHEARCTDSQHSCRGRPLAEARATGRLPDGPKSSRGVPPSCGQSTSSTSSGSWRHPSWPARRDDAVAVLDWPDVVFVAFLDSQRPSGWPPRSAAGSRPTQPRPARRCSRSPVCRSPTRTALGDAATDAEDGDFCRGADRQLAKVRRRGWAEVCQEASENLTCLAAPVRGHDGRIVAAMTVCVPEPSLKPSYRRELAVSWSRVRGALPPARCETSCPDPIPARPGRDSAGAPG